MLLLQLPRRPPPSSPLLAPLLLTSALRSCSPLLPLPRPPRPRMITSSDALLCRRLLPPQLPLPPPPPLPPQTCSCAPPFLPSPSHPTAVITAAKPRHRPCTLR